MIFKHPDREKEDYIMFFFVRACVRVTCVFVYSRLPYNAVNTLRAI